MTRFPWKNGSKTTPQKPVFHVRLERVTRPLRPCDLDTKVGRFFPSLLIFRSTSAAIPRSEVSTPCFVLISPRIIQSCLTTIWNRAYVAKKSGTSRWLTPPVARALSRFSHTVFTARVFGAENLPDTFLAGISFPVLDTYAKPALRRCFCSFRFDLGMPFGSDGGTETDCSSIDAIFDVVNRTHVALLIDCENASNATNDDRRYEHYSPRLMRCCQLEPFSHFLHDTFLQIVNYQIQMPSS